MKPRTKLADFDLIEYPGDPEGATIVLFHGFGAEKEDLAPLHALCYHRPRPTWIFPDGPMKIPLSLGWEGRGWFDLDLEALQHAYHEGHLDILSDAFTAELAQLRQRCQTLIAELQIPFHKLFLGGFSQGAVVATDLLLHQPQRLGGLLILSGTVANRTQWQSLAHLHAQTPFFQSHGTQDAILPYVQAQALEQLLVSGGLKGKLTTFSGGHDIPLSVQSQLSDFLSLRRC